MRYAQKLYNGNRCESLSFTWDNGEKTIYNDPSEDLIDLFDTIRDSLTLCDNAVYAWIMPVHCTWYEDTDHWSSVIIRKDLCDWKEW